LLAWRRGAVRGTTLELPWFWTLAALIEVGAAEIAGAIADPAPAWLPEVRSMSAALTLCPAIALLGAKRPQQGIWQLLVVGFLAMAWTPAVLELALRPGQGVVLPAYISWPLAAVVLFLVANHAFTRYWPSALLAGAGYAAIFAPQWPVGARDLGAFGPLVGLLCFDAALLLVVLDLPPRDEPDDAGHQMWLDFRDAYGAVWALRIAERVNEAAAQNGWRVRLEWGGLQSTEAGDADVSADTLAATRLLRSLLRRFVDPEQLRA
jgi:hypothetical protein